MATKTYNGHPSYNAWNVSLWIGNDEGLYDLARSCIRRNRGNRRAAAQAFVDSMAEMGATRTPDGAPYTVTNVQRAMREL